MYLIWEWVILNILNNYSQLICAIHAGNDVRELAGKYEYTKYKY